MWVNDWPLKFCSFYAGKSDFTLHLYKGKFHDCWILFIFHFLFFIFVFVGRKVEWILFFSLSFSRPVFLHFMCLMNFSPFYNSHCRMAWHPGLSLNVKPHCTVKSFPNNHRSFSILASFSGKFISTGFFDILEINESYDRLGTGILW